MFYSQAALKITSRFYNGEARSYLLIHCRISLIITVDVPDLPAKKIYEVVLPEVVAQLTEDEIPYHRGSPYGGEGWDTADPTVGDIHQWDVWAGACRNYQDYDIMGGRFIRSVDCPITPPSYFLNVISKVNSAFPPSQICAQSTSGWMGIRRNDMRSRS